MTASGPVAKTPCFQCSGPGLIPGQGTRHHMPPLQLKILQLKILLAAVKTEDAVATTKTRYNRDKFKNMLFKKKLSGSG